MIDSQNSGIMGTEIEGKGYGYYSMRDVNNTNNEQSSGNNWPILYGEKSLPSSNREYADNGFSHRSTTSVSVVEFDKNALRQTMLEHEAIFKRHVAQLHCLYKVQRDMMDEVRRKDFHKHPLEPPPPSSTPFSAWNSSQDCEILDHRPSKVRKRLFDLQFTADQQGECSYDGLDYYPSKRGADASKGFVFLADLNELITQAEETESISWQIEAKSKSEFLHRLSKETSRRGEEDAAAIRSNGKGDWSYAEHYKNHLNSSSSQDAIQTLGFLQSEQRRELHGRKHSPFGVINHKTDWSQSWGKSIQNQPNPLLQTNSSLYSSKPLTTSNLCFSRPLANNHHNNGFYRGSSSGSKDSLACFPPVVGLDHLNPIDKGRKQNHHPHLPSWLIPDEYAEFKPKNPNPAETNSTPPPPPSRKILGFTITDYPPTSASLPPTTPILRDVKKEGIINSRELIDINVAYYDPDPQPEPEHEENKKRRTHIIIDLNSCITELEEDIPPMEPMKRNLLGPKFSMEIDLEAPPQPEEEDEEEEDDNVKIAAETILSISVSADEENCMEDPLGWFAEIVVRPPNNNKNNNNSLLLCEEIMDYFEAITLSLPEMKQEEYIPKEVINPKEDGEEELGGMMVKKKENRNRRSRRGRQKRDFQRDILPGLVSLSRHEVSEDIQTFSGLMKATGHTWQSGLTRGRRRRVVVELGPTPAVVVEEVTAQSLLEMGGGGGGSSLTTAAWGKTLRRPRRQRCPPPPNPNPNSTTTTASNSIISS